MASRDEGTPPSRPTRPLRQAGAEPLPGYHLIEPLGSGGFGDVWKCEAPGGLFKAVKFVGGDPNANGELAAQEWEAIESIKSIRHPFLLTLERVEVLDGVLVLVMELADRNLQSVLLDYQGQGLPGIPRDQLLRFLREAAEALDVINFEHGLQHLDVKPHNLFVISNHIKVADFGLVHRLPGADVTPSAMRQGGATPLYASPETLQGSLSRHSDQYSLAIVYQQLLTGTVPFWSPNPYQLLMQHISRAPDLSALPPTDRPMVRRALSKAPEMRFGSCMEFVNALIAVPTLGEVVRTAARPAPPAPFPADAATRLLSPSIRADQATVPTAELAELAAQAPLPPTDLPTEPSRTQADVAASAPTPPEPQGNALGLPQPSGLALPGYRFLTCVGRTPFGCLWTVQDADGRERLAHCLLNVGEFALESMGRLQTLRHPSLPEREVFRIPPGCLVLISDLGRVTLRDQFEQCRQEGLPGVPRRPLLDWLGAAAETIDQLYQAENLSHLGINATQLLVEGDRALLEDFGLISLLWLPSGRPAAQLNPRYSAPELHEPVSSPSADQYSLALVYAEMLTGVYPRTKASSGKSGLHRRPGLPDVGSGQHRRPGPSQHRPAGANGAAKVDLDFLPVDDRPVVARALHDDPAQRFPTCTAFIQALQAATPPPIVTEDMLATLPLVTPFARLMGHDPAREISVPTTDQIASDLIAAAVGMVHVRESDNARYIVHGDGAWEYRFPIRMFASLLGLKLEGFRQQWGAGPMEVADGEFLFQIQTSNGQGGFWPRSRPKAAGVAIRLHFHPPDASDTNQREALVRLGLFGDHGPRQETLLPSVAPRIFQSLRAYLQGSTEHALRERWPFTQRVGIYPVLAHLEIGKALEGCGRDVSLGGVRLLAPEEPPSEFTYLHFHETPQTAPFAVLGRIVRIQSLDDGAFELGVTFAVDGPPGA